MDAPSPPGGETPWTSRPPPNLPAAVVFEMAATDSSVTVVSQNLGADLDRVILATSDAPVSASVSDSGTSAS